MWKTDADGKLVEMSVFAHIDDAPVFAGLLKFEGHRTRVGRFLYDEAWLGRPKSAPLAVTGLPLRKKAAVSDPPMELPIPFYDASPDGWWGKAILAMAYPDLAMGAPEHIAAAGNDRVGHLTFGPTPERPSVWIPAEPMLDLPAEDDLEDLMEAADAIENGIATKSHLARLLDSGADIGGARPKARLLVDGEPYIAKFRASGDPFDHQRAEAACLSLAREAGIEVTDHHVREIGGRTSLLVKRFDRAGGRRFPYASAATVMGYPPSAYRAEGASYADMVLYARRCGIADCKLALFERMLLNCLLNNTDDHLHNHGFLNDGQGWRLSPLFDIVPQAGRALVLRPARKVTAEADPDKAVLAHDAFGLAKEQAMASLDRLRVAARSFPDWLRHHGMSDQDLRTVMSRTPHIGIR